MSDPEREVLLEAYVRDSLYGAWERLYNAHCWTIRNEGVPRWDRNWSMAADGLAEDIRQATALVGPVDLYHIGMSLITSGWFTKAVERIGLSEQPLPTKEFIEQCRALAARNGLAA